MIDFLAKIAPPAPRGALALAEGHVHEPQELLPFLVGPSRRDERDVHPPDLLDPVVVDLRKDDLLRETDRVIPPPVEGARRNAAEVADSRQRHVHEPVVELVHPRAAQRHDAADRLTLAELEIRDRFLRAPDRGLLT